MPQKPSEEEPAAPRAGAAPSRAPDVPRAEDSEANRPPPDLKELKVRFMDGTSQAVQSLAECRVLEDLAPDEISCRKGATLCILRADEKEYPWAFGLEPRGRLTGWFRLSKVQKFEDL